jgi:hypothetical protein
MTDRSENRFIDSIDEYAMLAAEDATYHGFGQGTTGALMYSALGLTAKAGEVAENVSKLYRDYEALPQIKAELVEQAREELGNIFWYAVRLIDELNSYGFSNERRLPSDILSENLDKMAPRKARNALVGSGVSDEGVF